MALSPHEELVFAELEARFYNDGPPAPGPLDPPYRTMAAICGLGGACLLGASQYRGLLIAIANLFGFATSSMAATFAAAGFTALLVGAFLLGRGQTVGHRHEEVAREVRPVPAQRR